jgi:hypothetical protein
MDYEKFKQDMEQDVLKNLANRGIEAETDVRHIDKLNDGYDALTVKAPGSVIGVNINLSSAFEAYEDGRDYIDIVERASDQAAKGITESSQHHIYTKLIALVYSIGWSNIRGCFLFEEKNEILN